MARRTLRKSISLAPDEFEQLKRVADRLALSMAAAAARLARAEADRIGCRLTEEEERAVLQAARERRSELTGPAKPDVVERMQDKAREVFGG